MKHLWHILTLGFVASITLQSATALALAPSSPALTPDWEQVVWFSSEGRDPNGHSVAGYCNGTLIRADLMVTAAHCVAHAWLLRSDEIKMEIGRYRYVTRPDGKVVRVGYAPFLKTPMRGQIHLMASLQNRLQRGGFKTQIPPEEDVAFIAFNQPVELDPAFIFAKLLTVAERSQALARLSTLAPQVTTINLFAEMSTDTKRTARLNNTVNRTSWIESKSSVRVAEGDSGGPLYVTVGKDRFVIAVVKGRGQSIFSNWDAFTVVRTELFPGVKF